MDRELLIEIGVEEMPASWLPALTVQLAERLKARLAEETLPAKSNVEVFATPRRLTACQPELVDRQEDRDETIMGPPVSASFDAEGHPTNAGLGFARKLGVDFDALQRATTPKGEYLSYLKHIRGRATVDVLPGVLGKVLRDLQFPKHMRWDAQMEDEKTEFTFGRPIRWLLYLYGGRVVPFTIARQALASSPRVQDVSTGAVTYGHRFLATSGRAGRAIKVRSFDEYRKKLAENFVILSRSERRDRIMRDLESQARRIGGRALLHQHAQAQALLEEVPDLVEFPAVVCGAFSAEFLTLPAEVLTTTLIHHQHFFPVITAQGALMPAFLAVTNTQSANDRAIATNAERVVSARLRDARFFWDADRRIGLEARLPRLEGLLFHKALGSYAAKATRVETLARTLVAGIFGAADQADATGRAARLSKADLATDMVREFTELQGIMGGIYAREAKEPEAVWKAIYHQYLPIGVEASAAPSRESLGGAAIPWAALSLADKLDTLVGLFLAGERPTGSRDPLGLRRQAHGVLRILLDLQALTGSDASPSLGELVDAARQSLEGVIPAGDGLSALEAFLRERLGYVLQQRGAAAGNVRAVIGARALADLRPADLERNLRALAEFAETPSFRQLAEAFKRVRNIARELGESPEAGDLRQDLKEPAEKALLDEIERRGQVMSEAIAAHHDYRAAYAEAAGFEPAVATFFKDVLVMADDPRLRQARLRLMKRLERLILQLGDISEIVAPES
ncbi:MAG TPA: glycine--tRNA ligase subunit beta [Vicinamibacterales bacterium]|nr:glycine--tRNA ligase subunit beta [Vicinamibacterales bacterium]